jgi:hypothetical protein
MNPGGFGKKRMLELNQLLFSSKSYYLKKTRPAGDKPLKTGVVGKKYVRSMMDVIYPLAY